MKVHYSSKSNEWNTPDWLFNLLDSEYNFELDPATDGNNSKCDIFYTAKEDGLSQDWSKYKVFCNPPYGREIGKWIKKAYEESKKGENPIVLLIPARTNTLYWHNYIYGKADSIYFVKGRIKFGDSNNSAPFPSAIVVYNDNSKYIGAVNLDKYKE